MGNCFPSFYRSSNDDPVSYPIQDLPYPIKKRFLEILHPKDLQNLRKTNIEFKIHSKSRKIYRRLTITYKKYKTSDEEIALGTFEKIFDAYSQIDSLIAIEFYVIRFITYKMVSKFSHTFMYGIKIACGSIEYKALKYLLHKNLTRIMFQGEIVYLNAEEEKKELGAITDDLSFRRRYHTSVNGTVTTSIMDAKFF